MILRPYQIEAVERLRAAFRKGLNFVMLYLPTGSGKTEVSLEMIRAAVAKGNGALFVCNKIELVKQASRRMHAAHIEHGVLQGANSRNTMAPVRVASIQTLKSRGYMTGERLIICDEAHACAAGKAYRELFKANPNAMVIGLSATPFSSGLGKVFQQIVPAATIRELVEQKFLVGCDIYSPSEPDLKGLRFSRGIEGLDYVESELAVRLNTASLVGDIVTHYQRLGQGKQAVCFGVDIAHSKHICERFNAAGIPAEHLDAYTKDAERAEILRRIDNGNTRVVCNVGVLAEGWDAPAVEVMICARPTKSLIRWIQMSGRILRPFPGKDKALILDHSGTARRLGFPTDDLPLRLSTGKADEAGVRVKQERLPTPCSSCSYLKPAKVHKCPVCGFAPQRQSDVQTQAGELVQMTPSAAEKRGRTASMNEKQEFYSGLIWIARKRGYKPGWASNQYRQYFGVWPAPGLWDEPMEPTPLTRSFVTSSQIRYAKSRSKQT